MSGDSRSAAGERVGENIEDPMATCTSDMEYFESYQDFDTHRLMLADKVRTNAYKDAIYNAKHLFEGKVIMDIGAGTGILSLFCANVGAKKVIAVEASELARFLPKVVEANGFQNVIEVIHSKVEDVKLDLKIDIMVSEWMGFYLLHESMLDSIFASPCKIPELWKNCHDFWNEKQYGFDLSCFSDVAKIKNKPEIVSVASDCLLSDAQLLWDLDLMKISLDELKSLNDRRFFAIEEDGDMQGICIWFTCAFPVQDEEGVDATLSTAPWLPETHWKQTVVVLPEQTSFEAGDITGWDLHLEKSDHGRSYKIQLECLDANEEHPVPCLCGSVKCELVRHFMKTHPDPSESIMNNTNV
ncbi:protein arginine N-methyltransferase 6 isoform X2 [Folsomia candida]|uniref:protein arginine N-methyltransferase 6 isoform X2 n=1 Tax=Folsomia candida TaxID=158441 RepID=UPI001604B8E3|nr:protein arginine N-methyltransferase 6 isoform X2 [Folsomia candida]